MSFPRVLTPGMTSPKYPVVVPGVGPVPAPGMIIGEAPGRTEIEEGRPFCGRSGALLDEVLAGLGMSRLSLYITNAFKGDVGSGNRNPTEDELDDHRGLLWDEISQVNPKAILLVGKIAADTLGVGSGRMGDRVGRWWLVGLLPAMVAYHPAYVLRGGISRGQWSECIGEFIDRIRDQDGYQEDGVRFGDGSFTLGR